LAYGLGCLLGLFEKMCLIHEELLSSATKSYVSPR
jgi:hypothetical protein